MKTTVLLRIGLVLLWLVLTSGREGPNGNLESPAGSFATTVYVCKSTGAKKYHLKETCRGLNNCKHEIVTMKQKDAESKGLGLCGWED